jgi:hypothetical protein
LDTRNIARTVVIVLVVAAVAYGLLILGISIAGLFGEGEESSLIALLSRVRGQLRAARRARHRGQGVERPALELVIPRPRRAATLFGSVPSSAVAEATRGGRGEHENAVARAARASTSLGGTPTTPPEVQQEERVTSVAVFRMPVPSQAPVAGARSVSVAS